MDSTTPSPTGLHIETELSRDLGLTSVLAIGIGTMVAAGIFTLSGLAVRNVGSAAIVSFLLAAVVATFTALTYCEFVSIYPESGEGYLYARRTFRPLTAYFVGWMLFLGYTSSCAFYIASLSSYFNEFIWNSPLKHLAGVAALVALTLLNVKGTKESGLSSLGHVGKGARFALVYHRRLGQGAGRRIGRTVQPRRCQNRQDRGHGIHHVFRFFGDRSIRRGGHQSGQDDSARSFFRWGSLQCFILWLCS